MATAEVHPQLGAGDVTAVSRGNPARYKSIRYLGEGRVRALRALGLGGKRVGWLSMGCSYHSADGSLPVAVWLSAGV